MTAGERNAIEIQSDDFASGIGRLLTRIVVSRNAASASSGYMLGFNAEAPTPEAMIRQSIDEIGALVEEHDARIVACDVSGVRETDEGYRLWGVIECVPGYGTPDESTRVDDISVEEHGNRRWRFRVRGEGL